MPMLIVIVIILLNLTLDRRDGELPNELARSAEKKDEYGDTIGPFLKYTSSEMVSILRKASR